jgi:release factor glutamine methyltransferase
VSGQTLGQLLHETVKRFTDAGIDSARLDARLLAARALEWDAAKVIAHPDQALSTSQCRALEELVARREDREPVALILGHAEFWSLDFTVTPDVLAPRPDSETLVEAALAAAGAQDEAVSILDFGTGTGCLLLALLSEWPNAGGLGIDVSEAALSVADGNARRLGLEDRARFQVSDWDADVDGRYDLVISNPPYIAEGDFSSLEPEITRFEPGLALLGGSDGLACYRALSPAIVRRLAPNGRAFVEIGVDQAETAGSVLSQAGLRVSAVHRDLAGHPRVIEAGLDVDE